MARINIEDSLFKDPRWFKLILKTQCEYKALGLITTAWILAQKYWTDFRAIPIENWPSDLNVLLDINFAEKTDDNKIYVKGSKDAFLWIDQRVQAGRKGGNAKAVAAAKRELAGSSETWPLTLSPTLSLTHTLNSHSSSNSSSTVLEKSKPGPVEFENENALILSIDKKILDNWGKLYEQEYLQRELLKAWNWYSLNPRKRPKSIRGWTQALSSWFERGWKHYVKNIETQKADEFSFLRKDENEPTNF